MHATAINARTRRGLALPATAAIALIVALLASLLHPGAAEARGLPARTSAETSIGKSVLTLLNQERAANHLRPLVMRAQLQASARRHDVAMANANVMSHQEAGEPALGSRVAAAGYKWSWAGENIGWNSDMSTNGVRALETMMYNEQPPNDGHRLNILSTHFTDIGVDVYLDNVHHKVWLTTDFGRP